MDAANQLCRLCAQPSLDLLKLFSEVGCKRRIIDKIHVHLPIQVTAEDCLPTSVCKRCIDALEVSHNLLKVCLDADSKLRRILELPEDPSHLAILSELKASIELSCGSNSAVLENDATHSKHDSAQEINIQSTELCLQSSEAVGGSELEDLFHCQSCSENFCSADLLLQHRTEVHNLEEQNYICAICAEFSQNFQSYVDHLCTHFQDDDIVWECGNCGCNILSVDALKLHMGDKCNIAPKKTALSATNSSSHFSTEAECTNKDSFMSCLECGLEYQCEADLNEHLKNHSFPSSNVKKSSTKGKQGVKCRVCGKTFESFWYMARHRSEDHSKEEVALALRRHGLDREKFECNVCGKLLSCHFTYKHHLQAHEGVRNHQCPHCGRSFIYLAQLKSHLMMHTGGQHACSMCSKQFPNAFALRVHIRTHTGERPFQCELCPKAFHSRANFEQHVVIHTDKRKYQCHLCPYRARRPEALRTHIRVHTNERPYACKICGRAFKQKYDCTKHERLHAKRSLGTPIKTKIFRSPHEGITSSIIIATHKNLADKSNFTSNELVNKSSSQTVLAPVSMLSSLG